MPLCWILVQDRIQCCDEQVSICLGKYQWRAQLDYIVMWTVRSGQDAAIAQSIRNIGCLVGRRLARLVILHQVQTKKQP